MDSVIHEGGQPYIKGCTEKISHYIGVLDLVPDRISSTSFGFYRSYLLICSLTTQVIHTYGTFVFPFFFCLWTGTSKRQFTLY